MGDRQAKNQRFFTELFGSALEDGRLIELRGLHSDGHVSQPSCPIRGRFRDGYRVGREPV